METSNTADEKKNLWEDVRDTIHSGVHGLKNVGDEIARQGRLRMDIFQTERRLKSAREELGGVVYQRFTDKLAVSRDEPSLTELSERIGFYMDELKRLNDDLRKCSGGAN